MPRTQVSDFNIAGIGSDNLSSDLLPRLIYHGPSAPSLSQVGQLWFDTAAKDLKVCCEDGSWQSILVQEPDSVNGIKFRVNGSALEWSPDGITWNALTENDLKPPPEAEYVLSEIYPNPSLEAAGYTALTGPDGSQWEKLTGPETIWEPRYRHSAVVTSDQRMWIIGGETSSGAKSDVWCSSDGVSWTKISGSAPWGLRYKQTSAVTPDDRIWIVGGWRPNVYLNDVWYTSDGIAWTQATSQAPWAGRGYHTSVATSDGKMWVIGGYNGNLLRDVWYSTNGTTWTQATASAPWIGRDQHASYVTYDGAIWVAGGHYLSGTTGYSKNDVWCSYDGST